MYPILEHQIEIHSTPLKLSSDQPSSKNHSVQDFLDREIAHTLAGLMMQCQLVSGGTEGCIEHVILSCNSYLVVFLLSSCLALTLPSLSLSTSLSPSLPHSSV